MKNQIGESAGRIWQILNDKEKVTIQQIPKLLNENTMLSYQAVGWLAREDKIEYHIENNKVYISLK
ncbi:MAG: winged helix-turn-helix domain-containing protein [bacterium]|nr:MAG: winged helix-turn-helix domain-containing protein [bacterium]